MNCKYIHPKYFSNIVFKISFYVIYILLFSSSFRAQNLILSEIMFAPSQSNSEFVEIYNNTNEIIDLRGFKIKYHTTSADEIISPSDNYQLNPKQYALIFETDYDFISGIYSSLIPDSTLLFVLDDNAFGSGGMANASNREIFLISALNDTIDSQTYTADNITGYSDERVVHDDSIWNNSIRLNGTPGFNNSVTPVQYDIEIKNLFPDSIYSTIGDEIILNLLIKNNGLAAAENFELVVYFDINKNMIGDPNELIFIQNYTTLDSYDSIFTKIEYGNPIIGDNIFIAELKFALDENTDNNFYMVSVKGVSSNELKGVVVINEIMYSPKNPEPEWLELFNGTDKNIDFSGLKIADNSDTLDISLENILVNPKQYLVVADDSSIINLYPKIQNLVICNLPTFNNSGDKVIILDSLNRMIDSLEYFSDWGGKNGNSLERIEPSYLSCEKESWAESNFPTPGMINSITQKDYDVKIDTVFTNPNVPLIGENYHLTTQINNTGKKDMQFNLQLWSDSDQDSLADKLLEETDLFFLSASASINIDFKHTDLITQNEENYVIKLIAEDDDTTNNIYFIKVVPSYPKNSILINEIMYASGNYEPEWIELYNNSEYEINMENWSVGDVLTNPIYKLIEDPVVIGSHEYLVITKNNSIIDFHRNIIAQVIELPFANLNNDEDGVVLKDRNNYTIDSLKYFNEWNEKAGCSLERVSVNNSSVNMNNWQGSIDIEGSTPGRMNSRTRKDYDLVFKVIESKPKFPVEGEDIIISFTIQNRGDKIAENFRVELSSLREDGVHLIEKFSNLFLDAGDSLTLITNENVRIEDTLTVIGDIIFSLDQDIINNYFETQIIPGFNRNTVLINEVMFKPNNDEPKWIELINNSDTSINIKNWLIGDMTSKHILTETDAWIEPDDYLVISDNSISGNNSTAINLIKTELPNLGATKDAIIIYDYRNAVIDSMFYQVESNFRNSVSLERVSLFVASNISENWTFSLAENNSTPGFENSISTIPDYKFADLIFTEIMFDPSDENSEFIELYNISDFPIELGGWSIYDEEDRLFKINDKSHVLAPNEFYVVSADSSILNNYDWLEENENLSILNINSLSLNNSEKTLILKDVKYNTIDSIKYLDSWHNSSILATKDISIELININLQRSTGSNWSSCVSGFGATPVQNNSIDVKNIVSKAKLKITPNPFSPDNDGYEDFSFINFNLTKPVSQVRIRIFDSKGRKVRSIANNQIVGPTGTIIFDGLDDNKSQLKMGIYIILFEAVNNENVVVDVIKEVVVVARKL